MRGKKDLFNLKNTVDVKFWKFKFMKIEKFELISVEKFKKFSFPIFLWHKMLCSSKISSKSLLNVFLLYEKKKEDKF